MKSRCRCSIPRCRCCGRRVVSRGLACGTGGRGEGFLEAGDRHSGLRPQPQWHDAHDSAPTRAHRSHGCAVLPAVADHRDRGQPTEWQHGSRQMRKMLMLLGFPDNRIIVRTERIAPCRTLSSRCRWRSRPERRDHPGDVDDASGAGRWGLRRRRRQYSGNGELPGRESVRERRVVRARCEEPVRRRWL